MNDQPDLAAHHTAEHILNAVMQRDFGTGRSIEVHFGPQKSKCDYRVHREITSEDIARIEAAVNAEIGADHPVITFVVPREQAERTYDMSKVPKSAESIRIVQIGALDVIPCVGRHVEHTRQLGRFVIRSLDMKDQDTVRVRYALER